MPQVLNWVTVWAFRFYSNTVPLFKNWWLLIIRDGYLPARLYSSALPAMTPLQRTGTASIKSMLDQKHKNVSLTLLQSVRIAPSLGRFQIGLGEGFHWKHICTYFIHNVNERYGIFGEQSELTERANSLYITHKISRHCLFHSPKMHCIV